MPYLVSQTFLTYLDQVANVCNYTSYLLKYLTYPPPPAPFPFPGTSDEAAPGCDVWTQIVDAALLLNPAFDIYRIFDMVCLDGISLFSKTAHFTPASHLMGRPRFPVRKVMTRDDDRRLR